MKITFLLSMLLLAHRDRPSWFVQKEENADYVTELENKANKNLTRSDLKDKGVCHLPHQIFEGPIPLQTDVEWHGFCPEHHESQALEPRGYHGRPFPLHDLQERWSDLEARMHKAHNLSISEQTEAAALALALASYQMNFATKPHDVHPAMPYLRYLKQAAPQWPESLNNQWPILEWIAVEFACQNKQEKERQFSNFASNEMLLLLKENRPAIDLETSLFWRLLNAHKRYEWALTDNRPMDALAYYRESHFHHSSLLASLSKPGVDYPQRAMNAGGKVSDFWFLVAFVGVLSVILWGRYHRGRIKSEVIKLPAQDGVFSGQNVKYEDDEAVTVLRAMDSSTPPYGDLASLWNSKLHTNQQWEDFKTKFNQCVPGFIPSLRLEYPRMTQSDIRLACLIRMGMTSV
ncbi:MAG: hypothetical protein ACKO7X_03215, partial [Bacteroidota bacterium]